MIFMVFNGTLEKNHSKSPNQSEEEITIFRQIGDNTQSFNDDHLNSRFFVENIHNDSFSVGAIINGTFKKKDFYDFMSAIEISVKNVSWKEISLSKSIDMLTSSFRKEFIVDIAEYSEHFGLENANDMVNGLFKESIVECKSKQAAFDYSANVLFSTSLTEELGRIYSVKKQSRFYSHPIHYMIEGDRGSWNRGALHTLLQSLYSKGRIASRRYSYFDIKDETCLLGAELDEIYKLNIMGTVVIRCLASEEFISSNFGKCVFKRICNAAKKYSDDVLTVFDIPTDSEKCKDLIAHYLSEIFFFKISGDLIHGSDAANYLNVLAEKAKVKPDGQLFRGINESSDYYAHELNEVFLKWKKKPKSNVFSAYGELLSNLEIKKKSERPAYEELSEMIGLDSAKKVIGQAVDYFKVRSLLNSDKNSERPSMHMVFTGNPGTAKTSTARLFAKIMKENGFLKSGKLVEVGRADLVGKYVGWTAQNVKKKFEEASGGVLFIDEAYSLATENNGSFGKEAIDTIVQEMENHRDDVVTIFAGYPNEMEKFLETNPGLRSRIAFHVKFDDYSAKELNKIACLLAEKNGLTLTAEAEEKLERYFETARLSKDFGNGRAARNIIEKARMTQASRLVRAGTDLVTEKDIHTLTAEDIDIPEIAVKENPLRRIGF